LLQCAGFRGIFARNSSLCDPMTGVFMTLTLVPFNPQHHAAFLAHLLSTEEWPFHSGSGISAEDVRSRIGNGFYTKEGVQTFLITVDGEITGFIRLFDLGDTPDSTETPLFDIRLKATERGRGIGRQAVQQLTDFVFRTYPNKNRLEATTRHDNIAMRRVLQACGFAKEAHYRLAWPAKDGTMVDCTGYGILRSDWQNKTLTPVRWQDEI
jgi:RimJ/RimL family protein N-acetyltransferase